MVPFQRRNQRLPESSFKLTILLSTTLSSVESESTAYVCKS